MKIKRLVCLLIKLTALNTFVNVVSFLVVAAYVGCCIVASLYVFGCKQVGFVLWPVGILVCFDEWDCFVIFKLVL
jgi:hypothetical protein